MPESSPTPQLCPYSTYLTFHLDHKSVLDQDLHFAPLPLYMPPSCSRVNFLRSKLMVPSLSPTYTYLVAGSYQESKCLSPESFVLPACPAELSFPYQGPFLGPHFCPHSMPVIKCTPLGSVPLYTLYPRVILDVPSDVPGTCAPRQGRGASGSQWFWTRSLVSHPAFGSCTAVMY